MENTREIFDLSSLCQHRARAARSGGKAEFLFAESAARLVDRLADIKRHFTVALELGCRDGALARRMLGERKADQVIASDIAPAFLIRAPAPSLLADAEALPFAPRSFDLVLSNLALHWTNDLPGALLQLRHALRPDGLLLATLFSGGTLQELREAWLAAESDLENGASPRVSPFADARDLAALLQRAGFALPVVDTDTLTATYSDALALMRDLRDMGETNALRERRRNFTRRATLLRAATIYQERFARPDGRIAATFEITTLTAWAPAESQQQPLPRGSAAARLAQALGTQEHKAGDKARP